MSNKFDCLITGGTRNGSAAEFTFQFVNDTEENRFICLIGNALGTRKVACTVIVGDAMPPSSEMRLDRWREGPLTYCRVEDVARLEASHAELLAAAKAAEAALRNYDIAGEFGWGSCRTPSQMEEQCAWSEEVYILRAAIAKAERSEDEPITDDEGAL